MAILLFLGALTACRIGGQQEKPLQWPRVNAETRPWTRWWWMGSSVDTANLGELLRNYKSVGLGGVEITPIYGVKGQEDNFIPYLSDMWMDRLEYTLSTASGLGLGVDMATGTGWPFGGPWVQKENASRYLARKIFHLSTGQNLDVPVEYVQKPLVRAVNHKVDIGSLVQPIAANKNLQALALDQVRFKEKLPLVSLMAYPENGSPLDITDKVSTDGILSWIAPDGEWTLYALFSGWHGKMVERAAPGGEGWVIDHFSGNALADYLTEFDKAFKERNIDNVRAFFNDSYEVDDARGQANWTPHLLREFQQRRGYDLREQLPALLGETDNGIRSRMLSDYRQTISELLLEKFTVQWREWAQGRNALIRNQAHGSPANLLDLYAASDIPETEGEDILRFKFASSAAHVTGKKLISAEAATWLNGHFKSTLGDVRTTINQLMLGGANHICYHGTNYSPKDAPWPGWLFYASVHFSPSNPFWNDFKTLNDYVTRCQSFLQQGKPDQDILVYMPIFDRFSQTGKSLLQHFDGMKGWDSTPFKTISEQLLQTGYSYDFISDRQILDLRANGQMLNTANIHYKTLLVPSCKWMPLETLQQLLRLAENGATIIWQGQLPQLVPGLKNYKLREDTLHNLLTKLDFKSIGNNINEAKIGKGRFLKSDDVQAMLKRAEILPEPMVGNGLRFVRRKDDTGNTYFIVNKSNKNINGWVSLLSNGQSAAVFNPMNADMGLVPLRNTDDTKTEIYLQLAVGESAIVKLYKDRINAQSYPYTRKTGEALTLNGSWKISFLKGGSAMPEDIIADSLLLWSDLPADEAKYFSGQVSYSLKFPKPHKPKVGGYWELELGEFHKSASVWLNGKKLGVFLSPAERLRISDSLFIANNRLEIRVSNGMGNRIIEMERQGIEWKKFHNINFSARFAENRNDEGLFDASGWAIPPSGLKGPVILRPVKILKTKPSQ